MPRLNAACSGTALLLAERDAADVADLYARCADYFMLQDGKPARLADAIDLFCDVPEEKSEVDQIVQGWRGENGLIAVAAILRDYPSKGVWYLGFMIVDAAARGRGIGRSIYDIIERWIANSGAQEIRLAVLEVNEAAVKLWRSLGYKELRRVGPDTFKSRSHHRVELCRLFGADPAASLALQDYSRHSRSTIPPATGGWSACL